MCLFYRKGSLQYRQKNPVVGNPRPLLRDASQTSTRPTTGNGPGFGIRFEVPPLGAETPERPKNGFKHRDHESRSFLKYPLRLSGLDRVLLLLSFLLIIYTYANRRTVLLRNSRNF